MAADTSPLHIVSERVLGDWAMMLVDPADFGTLGSSDEALHAVSVAVNGVVHGELSIVAPEPFLQTLAQNLLGADEPPPLGDCLDAFREMGNVLAGNFITEAYGADCVFEIIQPVLSDDPSASLEGIASCPMHCLFLGDDNPVAIGFRLTGK